MSFKILLPNRSTHLIGRVGGVSKTILSLLFLMRRLSVSSGPNCFKTWHWVMVVVGESIRDMVKKCRGKWAGVVIERLSIGEEGEEVEGIIMHVYDLSLCK